MAVRRAWLWGRHGHGEEAFMRTSREDSQRAVSSNQIPQADAGTGVAAPVFHVYPLKATPGVVGARC